MQVLRELSSGSGPDRVIDAVGIDAQRPKTGPAAEQAEQQAGQFAEELEQVAPETNPQGDTWVPGDAPSQALQWAVEAVAKAGTLAIIGVYPPQAQAFPIGQAMNKNLTVKMGTCNHRRYIPELITMTGPAPSTPPTSSPRSTTWSTRSRPTSPSTAASPAGSRSPSTQGPDPHPRFLGRASLEHLVPADGLGPRPFHLDAATFGSTSVIHVRVRISAGMSRSRPAVGASLWQTVRMARGWHVGR